MPRLCRLGFATHQAGLTIKQGEAVTTQRPELVGLPSDEMWRFGAVMFGRVFPEATFADLVPLLVAIEPDLVVYEEFDLGGTLAARATGVPAVSHTLGRQPADFFRDPTIAELARVWRRVSAEPFVDPFMTDPHIDISPPAPRRCGGDSRTGSSHLPAPRRPDRYRHDAPGVDSYASPRALVYVTLGTIVFEAVHSLRAVIDELARLDVDVLVTVGPNGDVAKLGRLPRNVRAERFVPQDVLMAHVDVAVHHCGSGTMLGSLAHGVPQLAIPHGADQYMNAEALQRSGAGSRLMPDQITPDAVAAHVRGLFGDPIYRIAARRIATEIRGDAETGSERAGAARLCSAVVPGPASVRREAELVSASGNSCPVPPTHFGSTADRRCWDDRRVALPRPRVGRGRRVCRR